MKAQTWRKFHRYLAVVIGLQLLLWTTSGLIFSWNPIKTVRGEHMIRAIESVDLKNIEFKDLNEILNSNAMIELVRCQVLSATLRTMLDQPVYELTLEINEKDHSQDHSPCLMEFPEQKSHPSAKKRPGKSRCSISWRLFDFFWMLHTMDYQCRDNSIPGC